MTKSNFSPKYSLSWDEPSNSTNLLLTQMTCTPPPHHHLPLSSTTSTENMSQPSKEETKITRESYIRSCELARVSWLAKWDGYKVGSHAAESLLVWSAARPARWHAGWEMTTNHLPNVTETSAKTVWQVASWRPGGFVLSTPTVKLVEQIKCLIYLGIFELVWQEGEKKKRFLYSDCDERNNNTCLTGEHDSHLYINKRTLGSTPLAFVLTPPWLNLYCV